MRARSILAVLAVVALVAAPGANAAAKKKPPKPPAKTYCNLLTDVSGDGNWFPPVSSKGLDILGGDIASGPKTIVAVLRLADTNFSISHDPWGALDYSWSFAMNSNYGQDYSFTASEYNGSINRSGAQVNNAAVTLKSFTVDTKANTFTWVIDRSVDKTLTRKNTVFKAFRAESDALSSSADHAPNSPPMPLTDTYPDLGRSCVHAS